MAKIKYGSPLVVESDCREVVNLITGNKSSNLEIGWIIYEAQQRIKRLKNVIVQHTTRNCNNNTAHNLAWP